MVHNGELLRLPEVKRLSGLSRSTIYRLESQGHFPARVRLSERATAWRATEIFSWLAARPRAATQPNPRNERAPTAGF
jgi:prophage regulatory protein